MPDSQYWDERWRNNDTPWDIGNAAPAITHFFEGVADKNAAILIPGCGNAYEAEWLLQNGFTNVTLIDISKKLTEELEKKFTKYLGNGLTVIAQDFFFHTGAYDYIIEQTFFCALNPKHRPQYVQKMHQLLNKGGCIIGLLFDDPLNTDHPPYGGNKQEYLELFEPFFHIRKMETAYNSIEPRQGRELFVRLEKR